MLPRGRGVVTPGATGQRAQRRPTAAPYFSLTRGEWIPYAFTWDATAGEFHGVEGARGFATYREAVEASRFLVRRPRAEAREIDATRTGDGNDG